jgi:hypothetical protein
LSDADFSAPAFSVVALSVLDFSLASGAVGDASPLRLSVTYQPDPLKTIPTG